MSRSQVARRTSLHFGNPLRLIRPKSSKSCYVSPQIFSISTDFEQTLAESLRNLKPANGSDFLSLSWMRRAMEVLSATHTNIKTLTTALNFPGSDWDEKWTDLYMDNSIKALDICNGLTSGLSRLDQCQFFLKYALHILASVDSSPSSERLNRARSHFHDWMQKIHSSHSKDPKLERCSSILKELASTLHEVKVKNSEKGKVLMRALYGVKIVTIFVCGAFAAALSGCCSEPPMSLDVSGEFLWAEAFNDVQASVNGEINRLSSRGEFAVLREVEAVAVQVEKLHGSGIAAESSLELGKSAECFATELDLLSEQMEEFFQLVLAGRNAFLSSLKGPDVRVRGKADEFCIYIPETVGFKFVLDK